MKKYIFIGTIFLIIALLFGAIFNLVKQKQTIAFDRLTLPEFSLKNTKGGIFSNKNLHSNRPTLFIFFDSSCDYCDFEAKEISKRWDDLKNFNIIFIGKESHEEVVSFTKRNELDHYENLNTLLDLNENLHKKLHIDAYPSILIFSIEQTLIKHFEGKTPIKVILKYLS